MTCLFNHLVFSVKLKFLLLLIGITLLSSHVMSEDKVVVRKVDSQCILGDTLSFAITAKTSKKNIKDDFSKIMWNGKVVSFKKDITYRSVYSSNGYRRSSNISYQYTYLFTFSPDKVGAVQIKECEFQFDGKKYFVGPLDFTVFKHPVDKNFHASINIVNKREYYYPTEMIDVEITFGLNSFTQFSKNNLPYIENFNLLNNLGLEYVSDKSPNYKVLINNKVYGITLFKGSQTEKKRFKYMRSFKLKFRIIKPNDYNVSDCVMKTSVDTGKFKYRSSYYGTVKEPVTKVVYALPKRLNFIARELPKENVPLSFDGAIGNFSVVALSNNSMGVKVGDPVVILLTVKGKGGWGFVHAPPLHKLKSFTDYFRINQEAPVGELASNKRSKLFKIKMRVKSKTVKEIPAIPFTYYSISKNKYVTTYTKPIPLKVFANQEKVNIINFNNVKRINPKLAINDKPSQSSDTVKGNSQKKSFPKIETRAIFKDNTKLDENHSLNSIPLFISMLPLLILFVLYLVNYIMKKGDVEVNFDKKRSKNAGKNYVKELDAMDLQNGTTRIYNDMGMALEKFLQDKLLDQSVRLDEAYFDKCFDDNLINEEHRQQLKDFVEKLDHQRYSNQGYDSKQALSLLADLKDCIQRW